jgi:hypothetical protein
MFLNPTKTVAKLTTSHHQPTTTSPQKHPSKNFGFSKTPSKTPQKHKKPRQPPGLFNSKKSKNY